VPVVCGETAPEPLAVLRARAAEVGAPFHPVVAGDVTAIETTLGGTRFRLRSAAWGDREVSLALVGAHQARNAAVAAELLGVLPADLRPDWAAVERGFAEVSWPGRFQVERRGGQTWIYDVAHNPEGVAALYRTLDAVAPPRPLVLLTAILSDKDWRAMLPPLAARADAVVLTIADSAPDNRRWDPEAVAAAIQWREGQPVRVIPSFRGALRRAETLAPYGTVLVTGSVHTVGEALSP
jgi:dihydrofolate synthase/folylpolyglutamate synthase